MEFFIVYIREAHPEDGWQMPINVDEGVVFAQPTTFDERAHVAESCVLHLDLKIPTLIDDMDDRTEKSYAALPDRLYLIDARGKIAFASAPGPWGFLPEELEAAIKEQLG